MQLSSTRARYLSVSALLVILGIVMSGPVGMFIVKIFGNQPYWQNARVFVESYSSIQALPFVFGFFVILGFVLFFASLINVGKEEQRPLEVVGIVLSAIFGALIGLNYLIQVAYIPHVLERSESFLFFMAMSNPESLPWAIEMFGYGILGLATLSVAPLFSNQGLQKYIKYFLILNGFASIIGVGITVINLSWVLSTVGIISYVIWNILILVIMLLVIIEFRFG